MCKRYYFEDECPFYPDCASCYDPESIDYMWREDDGSHQLVVDLIDDAWLEIQAIFILLRRKINEI